MQTGWLAQAGPYKIEHLVCPDYAGDVDVSAPPKGVLHTTEGSWDGAMSVFRQHYPPHFLVGPGRIAQLLPLGRAAAALEHPNGTPATNGVCRAQIEVVGNSRHSKWLPDAKTTDTLSTLMAELERVAEIPLKHAPVARNRAAFDKATGWMGHVDVPDNAHWDPGALDWTTLLDRAGAQARAGDAYTALHNQTGFYAWLSWYLGEGAWKPYGRCNPKARPNVPRGVPRGWWKRELAFVSRRST